MTVSSTDCEDSPNAIAETVLDHVQHMVPEGLDCDLTLDSSLREVGLDSIMQMDVVSRLEEAFAMRFSEESLYDMETCRDLVDCIETVMPRGSDGRPSVAPVPLRPKTPLPPQAEREILPEHYDVTQFPACVAFEQRVAAVAEAGIANPFFRVNPQVNEAIATIDGREVVSYASFDYLGMADNPKVVAAAKQAIDRFGTSASASRLVGGNNTILETLDEELARFIGTEAAIVSPSGYGTNASFFGHLFSQDDLILYDDLAHNSIVEGLFLSNARRRAFPHNDIESLDKLLCDIRSKHRRVVLVVEGVYSMDGDYPDLPRLIEVKRRHQALLYVDEAHSIGVMGANGRGICEHFGVDPGEGDFWMGTISKALGSGGGYLAGRKTLIEYLKYTTPSPVFATAASPANTAAALTVIRLLREGPEYVTRLRDNARLFLELARDAGLNTGNCQDMPVIPIILGNSMQCLQVSHALLQHGINAQPILYPAVPESASRVRFFIRANHTEEQIRHAARVLPDCIAASEGVSG